MNKGNLKPHRIKIYQSYQTLKTTIMDSYINDNYLREKTNDTSTKREDEAMIAKGTLRGKA